MSVADTVQDLDDAMVDLQGLLGVVVTWQRRSLQAYNPTTGAPTSTDTPTSLTVIIQDPTDEQLPSGQTRRHIRFIVRTVDLAGVPVSISDYFVYGGFNYEVFAEISPNPGATQICDARLT